MDVAKSGILTVSNRRVTQPDGMYRKPEQMSYFVPGAKHEMMIFCHSATRATRAFIAGDAPVEPVGSVRVAQQRAQCGHRELER